jgi:osmoprotectant transport system ATP-binding protein
MPVIELRKVSKTYDNNNQVINDMDLSISEGEVVMLVGASGCGKTTLLKMINRLIEPTAGEILIDGKNIREWDTIKLRRSIGYVIQEVGLFPHLTVEDNITYVLGLQKTAAGIKKKRASELINLVGLPQEYLKRYPRELSGGESQRVGVARALAADPRIILMDEPFGAVDEISRKRLQDELIGINSNLGKTIVFVTHDIQEAFKLGSRIVLINEGRVEQQGSKLDLILRPETEYVKDFFGLKGFKAILDNEAVAAVYGKILRGEMSIDELYKKMLAQ